MFSVTGMTVQELIGFAYSLRKYQIENEPKWVDTKRFDIIGKDTTASQQNGGDVASAERVRLLAENYTRLQNLLALRFKLKFHEVSRAMPVHALVVSKGGRLKPAPCAADGRYYLQNGFVQGAVPIRSLVALLSNNLDRPMVDKTNLSGCFAMDFRWTDSLEPQTEDAPPALATALSALGLKLKSSSGPVQVMVIDQVTQPTAN